MKHVGPHCQKPGVGNAALRWATRESPAHCGFCGSGIGVFTWMTLIGCLVLGVTLSSVWIVVAGLLTTVVGNVWMWRRCELFPVERKTAQTAQRVGWAATLLAVAMAFLG